MIRNILSLFLLLSICLRIPSQKQEDTINNWKARFTTLGGIPMISSKGNWIGINKRNRSAGDSAFVVSTKDHTQTVFRTLDSPLLFLNEEGVLAHKGQKVEFINLMTGANYLYENIVKVYILKKLSRFVLLSKDHHLRFYDTSGKQLMDIAKVDDLAITDSKDRVFLKKKKDEKWEVLETSGEHVNVVYSTDNKILKMELTPLGKELIITETAINGDHDRLVVLDTQNSGKELLKLDIPKRSTVNFSEIQEGKAFLIAARVNLMEDKDHIVEIWYGNDPYVNERYKMFSERKFWIWYPRYKTAKVISVPENTEVNSLNNDRYFLTYQPRKGHNYITSDPALNEAQILDLQKNAFSDLGDLKIVQQSSKRSSRTKGLGAEIFCSADGKLFLASPDGIKWNLYSSNGKKQALIDKEGLGQPIFSFKGDRIYFESSNDLWRYDIKQHRLIPLEIGKGKISKIRNYILKRNDRFRSIITYLPKEEILAEIYDMEENTVSYSLFKQQKWQTVIPFTDNRINPNCLVYNPGMTSFYTLEENYNLPPTLYRYNNIDGKYSLFDGNIKDNRAKKIKQEIYSYTAVGKNLKGILYYPIDFDPTKTYPMVVHIYELQRETSNEYLSPDNLMPVGFQIRTLLERGYFVYLPDIAHGEKGAGISAMECVDIALDSVLKNPYIDPSRIGLGGHSHGGYETNFIATHSSRFATYISGAGNSDLIRSYYSYNNEFTKPFYFQFETGQYNMGSSVAEDKERYLKNSPILNVDRVNVPILLWAGKKDENIQWGQVMEFYVGLRRYNKDVVALFYPEGGHDLVFEPIEAEDRNRRILQWWDYFLKDKKNVPWISKQLRKDTE